ncbi:hypothetical protein QYF36_007967 [Acer negundo]|nr:hypothetical protein QYF36_007967 [Acer negundo]
MASTSKQEQGLEKGLHWRWIDTPSDASDGGEEGQRRPDDAVVNEAVEASGLEEAGLVLVEPIRDTNKHVFKRPGKWKRVDLGERSRSTRENVWENLRKMKNADLKIEGYKRPKESSPSTNKAISGTFEHGMVIEEGKCFLLMDFIKWNKITILGGADKGSLKAM